MMPILKWIDQNAEKALASVLLAAIVLLISGNVFMRYVMNASLSWGEELTLWLFVWFVWIGVSYAFHTGDHVRMGFLLVLTYECVKLITMPFVKSQSSVVLGLPIPILYSSAPVGAGLSAIRVIQHFIKTLRLIAKTKV